MKRIISIASFILYFSFYIQGQESELLVNGKLFADSLYKNKTEHLLFSEVVPVDSLNKQELKNRFKNWAGTKFASLKDVIVSETEDQLVLVYIDKSLYSKTLGTKSNSMDWYIRIVIEFKDGKFRLSLYDDGNTFRPTTKFSPSISARTFYFIYYFKENDESILVAQKPYQEGLLAVHKNTLAFFNNAKSFHTQVQSKKDDW